MAQPGEPPSNLVELRDARRARVKKPGDPAGE
jgi:hypothetical protein